jgi:hypothetical protein
MTTRDALSFFPCNQDERQPLMFASHVAYPMGLSSPNSYSTSLHKIRDGIANCYTLLYIKDIFVFGTIRGCFKLFTASM